MLGLSGAAKKKGEISVILYVEITRAKEVKS